MRANQGEGAEDADHICHAALRKLPVKQYLDNVNVQDDGIDYKGGGEYVIDASADESLDFQFALFLRDEMETQHWRNDVLDGLCRDKVQFFAVRIKQKHIQ